MHPTGGSPSPGKMSRAAKERRHCEGEDRVGFGVRITISIRGRGQAQASCRAMGKQQGGAWMGEAQQR